MGCPQSKSKSKNIAVDENGGDHGSKLRNDGVRPKSEEPTPPRKTVEGHKDADDEFHRGRADNFIPELPPDLKDDDIKPVFDPEQESEPVKDNLVNEALKNEKDKDPKTRAQSEETAKNGFASVYQAEEEEPSVEYDRFKGTDNTDGGTVDITDVDIGQGVSEIEVTGQTINLEGEDENGEKDNSKDSKGDENENKIDEDNIVRVEGGYIEVKNSLKDHPNVRYQSKETIEYGLPKDVPKPAPPKSKKNDIINATTFTIADRIVDETPDVAFQSVPKLASYLAGDTKKSELTADVPDPAEGKNIPLPKPSKLKKKDIVKRAASFKAVDENAKSTPEAVRLSVQKLADHLCSAAASDMEKVRAFYYWICHNISYMYDVDSKSDHLRYDAVSTLRQGKGSFVNLMAALCNEAKIPVVTIPGCSKGLRHQPDKVFTVAERNHSWNAVYINGEWRFIDCTWGSGYVALDGRFKPQFDEFWFLTDPEIFIYDHFPTHPIWQLLEEPIDIDEFNHKPSLTEKSRELGLKLISHREPIVYFDKEVTVTFGTDTIPLSNITADLRTSSGKESNKHRCIQRLDSQTFGVKVVPPERGEYSLTVFGKSKDYLHAKFRKLIEYTLRCESVYGDPVLFPDHYKAWGPEPNYKELGFAESVQELSVLQCDSNEHVITLEQTKNTAVTAEFRSVKDLDKELDDLTLITSSDSSKFVHLRFPGKGYYKLDIYAEGKLEKYEFAAAFLIYCTANEKPRHFPKYNAESVTKFRCRLIEPMCRELPANTEIEFRIESRDLKKAMLGIPVEAAGGQGVKSCGELKKDGKTFKAKLQTPSKGETLYLTGCSSPPNIFWSRMYEFVTV